MPGMSGLDLQAALHERGIALPVVVLTAHGDVATTRAALKNGAVDFLEKPVDDAILIDVLRTLDGSVSVLDVGLRRPTLDDVFLTLTGHATAAENGAADRRAEAAAAAVAAAARRQPRKWR